jgi:fumarate hydratase subunit beta
VIAYVNILLFNLVDFKQLQAFNIEFDIIYRFGGYRMNRYITAPLSKETIETLKSGDYVYISGTIYTARDAAHKRMFESLESNEENPFNLKDNIIYYLGPTPAREGMVIGSAGPTTSSRMDKYTPLLMEKGLKGMIGKGKRSSEVIDSIKKYQGVYFASVGGAGALLSKCITKSEVIAYDDLGTEAIRKLEVKDFPVIVVIDSQGNNLYDIAVKEYFIDDMK